MEKQLKQRELLGFSNHRLENIFLIRFGAIVASYIRDEESRRAVKRLFLRIFDLLCQPRKIPDQALQKQLRLARGVLPEGYQPNPGTHKMWGMLFFGQNVQRYLAPKGERGVPAGAMKALQEHLPALQILDWKPDEFTYNEHDRRSWCPVLQKVIEGLEKGGSLTEPPLPSLPKRYQVPKNVNEGRLEDDLVFVGSVAQGIKYFEKSAKGAVTIYNTVFSRETIPAKTFGPEVDSFTAKQLELIKSGCIWTDIALRGEVPALKRRIIGRRKSQPDNYQVHLIDTELPLLQCLIINKRKKRGLVLVGWLFPGSRERVYASHETDTIDFFTKYCERLCQVSKEIDLATYGTAQKRKLRA